jgi:predicted nuclease with TOPRIM domain
MSGRATKLPQPKEVASQAGEGAGIVQQLLAERRELMVANERLRIELEELRGRGGGPDPRLHVLQLENRALRDELAAAQEELRRLREAIARLIEEIEKASL